MRDRIVERVAAVAVAALALDACGAGDRLPAELEPESAPRAPATPASSPAVLSTEGVVERTIAPGEKHDYRLELAAGELFELTVEQRGVDLVLRLFDPAGELALEADLPIADLGPEQLLAVATHGGTHRVEIEAWQSDGGVGGYAAGPLVSRPATAGDRLRARAARRFWEAESRVWAGDSKASLEPYRQALELWRQAGDLFWEAETLDRLGDAHYRLGERRVAADLHRQASERFATLDQPRFWAINTFHLASFHYRMGEMEPALRLAGEALELRRQVGDARGEAMVLSLIGDVHKVRGETQLALDHFAGALALLDRPQDRRYRASTLHNLGTLYRRTGKLETALVHLEEAEGIFAALAESRQRASSLSLLGQLRFELGDPDGALATLRTSLELRRGLDDRAGQAVVQRKIGSMLLAGGDLRAAREHFVEALSLLAEGDSPRSRAALLTDLGTLHNRLDRAAEALEHHRAALAVYEQVGDPLGSAEALLGVAVSERQRGELEPARVAAERALEITEELRIKAFREDLRWSFFSAAQRYFAFYVDLLMELHRALPGAGHDAAALEVSERARARSLLDLLREAGAGIRDRAASELLVREREIQERINGSVARMEDDSVSEAEREAAARDLARGLEELEAARAAIRRQSPRYAALTQPRTASVAEIRSAVLDPETVLLEYWLGEERSFVWRLAQEGLESFELPPAAEIESAVRSLHSLLAQGHRRENEGRIRVLLCTLGRQLVAPLAGRLGDRRLAIVADGALQYLPFALLPDPDTGVPCLEAPPLLAAHEIVFLPSASTVALSRRERAGRKPPGGLVAVLADPVFSGDDERLRRRVASAAVAAPMRAAQSAAGALRTGELRRLPHTRREAEAILGLVPADAAWAALGFEASKQTVLSGRLAGFRIVHFATHGVLDSERPQLSGVVLSRLDREGVPVDGHLRAHEAYNLELAADLVVLSGCETALGRQVRGEGMLGLARGFMYAGAPRLAVSLWQVSDRATAELMTALYRGLLNEGLTPAAALRAAQLEVRAQRPQPFYWAGFVLQGDWRRVE